MIGKGPSVRIVVPPSFRRNFPFLLQAGEPPLSLRAVEPQVPAGCVERVGRIRTELRVRLGLEASPPREGTRLTSIKPKLRRPQAFFIRSPPV
jgi:hypothetical protein